ncbi:MAG TPA: glycosyltransferase family 39 protein [Clostridia bacterium]|nr:glycosyltransferase family 39 protein [Clostridia bacterium]
MKDKNKILLVLIILLAAFLRLWGSWRLDLFTYDQARDATYIRRIFTERKFPLVGPQSSIPGVTLGPGYYYLMALPLLLFNFDPSGIDMATGIINTISILLLYKLISKISKKEIALSVCLLYAVSPIVVELTRRAWNLSTLPFFSISIIYLINEIKVKKKNLLVYFLALFASLGIAIQLHYSALLLFPPILITLFIFFKHELYKNVKAFLLGFSAFFFLNLPILIFNFRHHWIMPKAIMASFFQEGNSKINLLNKIIEFFSSFWSIFEGTFLYNLRPLSFLIFALLNIVIIWRLLKKNLEFLAALSLFFIFFSLFGSLFYPKGFSFFYLVFLLPMPYFLLASALSWSFPKFPKKGKWFFYGGIILLAGWLFYRTSKIIFRPPVRTRNDFVQVAKVISDDLKKEVKFNLAAIYHSPGTWENYYRRGIVREDIRWDHNAVDYGYFVERKGFKPLHWDNFKEAQVLYLIAEEGIDNPLALKFWEIKEFGPGKVVNQWQLKNGTTIYKLER